MAISPPKWAKDATPTLRGWVIGNELVISRRHTQQELDEYFGGSAEPEPAPVVDEPVVEEVTVSDPVVNLSAMTKAQLVEYAANAGIEVDSKLTKAVIIETIENA